MIVGLRMFYKLHINPMLLFIKVDNFPRDQDPLSVCVCVCVCGGVYATCFMQFLQSLAYLRNRSTVASNLNV